MSKVGQAKVLTDDEYHCILENIELHRHPEKNALIVEISCKLGLRVQEISLLRIREVATLSNEYPAGFILKDMLRLPKGFTKGARAIKASNTAYDRKRVSFSVARFDEIIRQVVSHTEAGVQVNPEDYYPALQKKGGKTRELPLVDDKLIAALHRYLLLRSSETTKLRPNDPLILSQKGGPYSPNTLQDHIAKMYKKWAGVDRASSHSGRRTLITKVIRDHNSIKAAQKIAGHKDPATTIIYHDVPEEELRDIIECAGKSYEQ